MSGKYRAYRDNPEDKVLWVDKVGAVGEYLFTFDKKKVYNLFRDYPDKLTFEEWMTFNDENPYWKDFFKDRNEKYAIEHAEEIKKAGRIDVFKGFE